MSTTANQTAEFSDAAREATGRHLQLTLAELIALSLIAKQLHWNVRGRDFQSAHLQLDELAAEWQELADVAAERAASINRSPDGRVEAIATADVEPIDPGFVETTTAIRQLEGRLSVVAARVRSRCELLGDVDLVSQDVLIGVTRRLEEQLWKLCSQCSQW